MNHKVFTTLLLYTFATSRAMSILDGKRVLITGGGRGIGRAIAHICAKEGAQVAICSRSKCELEETIATCITDSDSSPSMDLYVTDLSREDGVDEMVKSIVNKWGGIDVLINNAGRNQAGKGPTHELDTGDFKDLLDLNIICNGLWFHLVVNNHNHFHRFSNYDLALKFPRTPLRRKLLLDQ